ncbi:MAG: hypothetical protein LUD22_01310 [Coprobacillus sp.]|nr:hypothetical protein [Coprobacillus sp.]
MSRSKVSILSKYVLAIAILALLFSVSLTTARYAVNQSSTVGVDIDSFDVDVSLYHDTGNGNREQVSGDINLDTNVESLSNYKEIYYLDIKNNDSETLYYKVQEETGNFCFTIDSEATKYTTYAGEVESSATIELTLTMSIHPDVLSELEEKENRTLSIKLYAEYQHSDVYESVYIEEEEPEPESEDENHKTEDGWTALTSSNISTYTTLTSGSYQFYLTEDISLNSSYFNWSNVSATICLNNHTLTGSASYIFYLNSSSSLTVEDCQGSGLISLNSSNSQAIYLNGGTTLTMTSGTINGGSGSYAVYLAASNATLNLSGTPVIEKGTSGGVYLPSGATINLVGELKEGADIGVTSASSITESNSVQISSTETNTYYYESAINYIHSDNSSYKISINHASNGYLTLISKDYVNINVAIHYTNGTTYSNPIYFNGDGAAYMESNLTLSTYSGTYAYNSYVQYPNLWSINSDFNFVISANTDNMWYSGFAKTNDFTINWSDSNYNLWNTQYWWNSNDDNGSAVWGCTFSSLTSGIMSAIGDFVIVLELSSTDISNSNSNTNNIVSNAYFIVDGVQQNLV